MNDAAKTLWETYTEKPCPACDGEGWEWEYFGEKRRRTPCPACGGKTAKQLGQEGMARALANSKDAWRKEAMQAIKLCAKGYASFTATEFRALCKTQPHSPGAIGAVFQKAAKEGIIIPTGEYRQSSLPSTHGRPQKVWVASPGFLKGAKKCNP